MKKLLLLIPFILMGLIGLAHAQSLEVGPGFSTPGPVIGTATNNSAPAGIVGEYVESIVTNASPTTGFLSGVAKNITSISLTAGDWDVSGSVQTAPSAGTTESQLVGGFSQTTDTLPAVELRSYNGAAIPANGTNSVSLPRQRVSLASTTTIYLVMRTDFAVSTMGGAGFINARRVR